ncbi:hypothetical protein [Methylobacterium bullatum]|uniref:Uncharacterized protein n=1 Tax=Methylobacterium bullatum TaxID=570505 RepID=A0AAV4ZB76_9HYPH|nr:hypothetical protein [Methylobacterium bullatum]MBD8900669.1 hypothetical protein [Methylobacterium bullatum]GJD40832.1 hypothetical protein OICFNHDK_3308 [Methylobacterium bullatum]
MIPAPACWSSQPGNGAIVDCCRLLNLNWDIEEAQQRRDARIALISSLVGQESRASIELTKGDTQIDEAIKRLARA